MVAHDNVTHGALARKILKKITDSATQIELTLTILMPRPWNLLKNSSIHFHICYIPQHKAWIQTFFKFLKSVTSACGDKNATRVVYLSISNIFFETVNVNDSPFYETSKHLIRVLMN